jgi:prepilin-type N-terminal cleavage/methylation domain-containing protein
VISSNQTTILPPFRSRLAAQLASAGGFTLIELLVVIGIISILASMLLPTLGRSKGKAHMTQCLNNMRQLCFATTMYVHDHSDRFPSSIVPDGPTFFAIGGMERIYPQQVWLPHATNRPLFEYLKPSEVYRCTEDNGSLLEIYADPWLHKQPTIQLKPTCWAMAGCSYAYSHGYFWFPEDTKYEMDGMLPDNRESWVSNPAKFILFNEYPAVRITVKSGGGVYCHWHERKRLEEFLEADLPNDPSRFISPVGFVDGHVARHDFTDVIKNGLPYIYEETKDWIWYKPKLPDLTGP